MITEQELVEREQLSKTEIEELLDHFDLNNMDLADDALGVTYATFQSYYYANLSESHHRKIVHYFLQQFGDSHMEKDTPSSEIKEMKNIATVKQNEDTSDEEATSTKQEEEARPGNKLNGADGSTDEYKVESDEEESEQDFPKGAADLEYLVPDRIIFRPKNGLAQALQEASELSEEKRAQVHVRDGSRLISLKVESQS